MWRRATLAAVAMTLVPAAPAHAVDPASLAGGSSHVSEFASVSCGPGSDGHGAQSATLPFGRSFRSSVGPNQCGEGPDGETRFGGTASSAASINVSARDGENGLSISGSGAVSAATTQKTFPDGGVDDNRGRGTAGTLLGIEVTAPVPYTMTIGVAQNAQRESGGAQVSFSGPQDTVYSRSASPGSLDEGPRSDEYGSPSGTLQPGTYQLNAGISCSTGGGKSCSAGFSFELQIGDTAPAVAIASGPSGTTRETSATFEFGPLGDDPPPGNLECRIDGGSFDVCSSPRSLSGLSDGEHAFEVRYKPNDGPAGPVTERRWTVDTGPPRLQLDSGPSGADNPPDVTIAWSAPDGDAASFRCKLDGGDEFDCTSPQRLVGLAPGPHSFEIVAIDATGNRSGALSVPWEVGAPATPPPPVVAAEACPPGAATAATVGVITAVAREPGACFVQQTVDGAAASVAGGHVTVNGIGVKPDPGTRIELIPGVGGGTLKITGGSTLVFGRKEFRVDSPIVFDQLTQAGVGVVRKTLGLGSALLGGLPVKDFDLVFSADEGGKVEAKGSVELPITFRSAPGVGTVNGLTLTPGFSASNARGTNWNFKGKIAEAWLFGRVRLQDLEVGYDDEASVFTGSVGVDLNRGRVLRGLPASGEGATLTAALELGPQGLIGPLRKLSLGASNIGKHIGDGVFLQRLGASLAVGEPGSNTVVWAGSGGASFGPKIDLGALFEGEAASLDGDIAITIPTSSTAAHPFRLAITGTGKVVEVPLVEQKLTYTAPANFVMTGKLDYTVAGFGVIAELKQALFDPVADDFNIEAEGRSNLPGLLTLLVHDEIQAVVSKRGMAVCFKEGDEAIGWGKVWGQPADLFADVCDMGAYRSAPQAAGADGPRSFTVDRGERVKSVALRGGDAPPKVDIAGPGGFRLSTPDGPEGIDSRRALLVQHPDTNTTFVVLFRPAPGRWTVTPRAGSNLTRVRTADPLPPVRVRARVRRGVLAWTSVRLPRGHRLTFVERAGAGQARNVVTGTRRSRGRRRLKPMPGAGRRRTVEVVVMRKGLVRERRVVARYTARRAPRLSRVRGLKRRGAKLSWKRQRGAVRYSVAVVKDGVNVIGKTTRRNRVTVPRGRITVIVVPIGADDRPGPARRVSLR